jgi:exopolysaccharide biosynthesis polyprenyl glycosylphosphotransferase
MDQKVDMQTATAGASEATRPLRRPSEPKPFRSPLAERYVARDYVVRRVLAGADILGVLAATALMLALSNKERSFDDFAWVLLTIPVWLVVFKLYGLYDRDMKRISHSTVDDLPWLLHALLVGCLLMWLYYYVIPVPKLIFLEVLLFGAFAVVAITLLRAGARRLTKRFQGPERVLLIGGGDATDLLLRKMRAHPEYGLEPVALVPSQPSSDPLALPQLEDVSVADLATLLANARVDRIVVCEAHLGEGELFDLLHRCKELSIKVSILPALFNALGPSVEVDDVEGVTVLGINPPVLSKSSWLIKRSLDVFGSALLLVLCSPFIVLAAVSIKLDSRGPVFFKQQRIGKGGRPFELLKFRTMVVGAEHQTAELLCESTDPDWLKLDYDPRITRVGKFLRLFSLDEMPQMWNVLKGEMSLVGPRPLIESEDRRIDGWARSRVDLTPGITGLWQVLGRTNIPFEEMIKLDYMYVTNWSLWTDIRLILKTLPVVITRQGAN